MKSQMHKTSYLE